LILVLHGAGERGADNEKQLTHGSTLFLQETNRKNFPGIVVFPQCPESEFWSSVAIDRSTKPVTFVFDYSVPPTASLTNVTGLITKLIKEEGVDASKVYITGLSMGGMGTFEMVYRNPNLFAAAMPICGGGDTGRYDQRILKTSFWIFHGGQDPVVDVKWSREMVDKLKQLKGDVTYSEYPTVQHDSWTNAFAEPKFMSWLFSHQRK
jgi:predicted peptidase